MKFKESITITTDWPVNLNVLRTIMLILNEEDLASSSDVANTFGYLLDVMCDNMGSADAKSAIDKIQTEIDRTKTRLYILD